VQYLFDSVSSAVLDVVEPSTSGFDEEMATEDCRLYATVWFGEVAWGVFVAVVDMYCCQSSAPSTCHGVPDIVPDNL